jgi:hypothetical protein
MIVKCERETPTDAQALRLGEGYNRDKQAFPLNVGEEYVVYGMEQYGNNVWIFVETDLPFLVAVPLLLFTITDGRVPPSWEVRASESGEVSVMPFELFDPYFLDDLSEGSMDAVRQFQSLKARLEGIE